MGRSSRSQADANRVRIVMTASGLFRARGVEAVGIADVMKAAGMTQGGFYRHFSSKEELAAEACTLAFEDAADGWRRVAADAVARDGNVLSALVTYYLTTKPPELTCPMIALAADAARGKPDNLLQKAYGAGVRLLFDTFVEVATTKKKSQSEILRLVDQFSSMVGANMLAQSSPATNAFAKALVGKFAS